MFFIIIACFIFMVFREIMFLQERNKFHLERKDLYNRIQAGTLDQYKNNSTAPSTATYKDREQKIAEETARRGITRSDLQYPSFWKG